MINIGKILRVKYTALFIISVLCICQLQAYRAYDVYASESTENEYVYFGEYPQHHLSDTEITEEIAGITYDENGDGEYAGTKYCRIADEEGIYWYFKYEPVIWRVMKQDEDKVYLLSDTAIDTGKFYKGETWKDSRLRKWLNGKFIERLLSEEEKPYLNTVNDDLVWMLNGEEWYSEEYGFSKYCKISENGSRRISASDYVGLKAGSGYLSFDGKDTIMLTEYNKKFGYLRMDGIVSTYDNSNDDTAYYALCPVICVDKIGVTYIEDEKLLSDLQYYNNKNADDSTSNIYFGYFPQTEVLGDKLTDSIINADYDDNDDTVVEGIKYRRISESDYQYDNDRTKEFFYFKWNEGGDDNGYHYFRYEPVKWRVLEENDGDILAITSSVIDTKPYDSYTKDKYSYETSTLRKYLISDSFINTMFTKEQQSILLGGDIKDGLNLTDKIWLPSLGEVTNPAYGFDTDMEYRVNDKMKIAMPTDFAHAMGAEVNLCGSGWWLRDICELYDGGGNEDYDLGMNAFKCNYSGNVSKYEGAAVSSREIGVRLMARLEKNSTYIFNSYDEAEKYYEDDNKTNYKYQVSHKSNESNNSNIVTDTLDEFNVKAPNADIVIYFGIAIIVFILILWLEYKVMHRNYIRLVLKNIKIFAKSKTYYFLMIIIGQIVSFVIMLMAYGILQNNLATKDEVRISDTMYSLNFTDENMNITDFKTKISELTKYMGEDFEGCSIFLKYKNESVVSLLVNPDYYRIELEGMFNYEQVVGDEYVIRVSKMLSEYKVGDEIEAAGATYKIVGKYNSDRPQVPINTLNEDCVVTYADINLHTIPMVNDSDRYNKKLKSLFGDNVVAAEPESIDLLAIQKNSFMIAGTVFVMILVIINAVLCYIYILKSRTKWIAVMQICGAEKKQYISMYLIEIMLINIVSSFVGMSVFVFTLYRKMVYSDILYKEIYSLHVYVYITVLYLLTAMVLSLYYIVKFVKNSAIDSYRKF